MGVKTLVNNNGFVGVVKAIRRFPVKSILGESIPSILIDKGGLLGDRLWQR